MASAYKMKTCNLTAREVATILGMLLDEFLGTLEYPNGQSRKAVSINKLDKKSTVEGLELVISPTYNTDNRNKQWICYLVARNDAALNRLQGAVETLERLFPRGFESSYTPNNYDLNNYPQVALVFSYGILAALRFKLLSDK